MNGTLQVPWSIHAAVPVWEISDFVKSDLKEKKNLPSLLLKLSENIHSILQYFFQTDKLTKSDPTILHYSSLKFRKLAIYLNKINHKYR